MRLLGLRVEVYAEFVDDNKAGHQPVETSGQLHSDEVGLVLQKTRSFMLTAKPTTSLMPGRAGVEASKPVIKRSTVTVPRPVSEGALLLPIPKPALFGKQTFQLALVDCND